MTTSQDPSNEESRTSGNSWLGDVAAEHSQAEASRLATQAAEYLVSFIDPDRYVGDLISMDYDTAEVLIHDRLRQDVGGVPHGCLLAATRVKPGEELDLNEPQTSLVLLRALRASALPNDVEMKRARLEAGQRAADTPDNWDEAGKTDQFTLDQKRYAGAHCRILGTFRMHYASQFNRWDFSFGGDINNFYAGQGMKVYKPAGLALERLANYTKNEDPTSEIVEIGKLRYAASVHDSNVEDAVPVYVTAEDFLAQRTALFGMTRTGKSNTTKIIASAVFRLRLPDKGGQRVGQLIFDPNGEYANENPQDQGCLRNLQYERSDYINQVHTYGPHKHPFDPDRHITKFNFYGNQEPSAAPAIREELDQLLQGLYQGKQIIDDILPVETGGYIQDFRNSNIADSAGVIGNNAHGEYTRFRRRIFIYRCILAEAGFGQPSAPPLAKSLCSKDVRDLIKKSSDMMQYTELLDQNTMTWDVAANFVKAFAAWAQSNEFKDFDRDYAVKHQGRNWSDPHLRGLLRFYENTHGRAVVRNAMVWHDIDSADDYAETVVQQVRDGNLLIVDQLLGDPDLNRQAAERIVRRLFNAQQQTFITP